MSSASRRHDLAQVVVRACIVLLAADDVDWWQGASMIQRVAALTSRGLLRMLAAADITALARSSGLGRARANALRLLRRSISLTRRSRSRRAEHRFSRATLPCLLTAQISTRLSHFSVALARVVLGLLLDQDICVDSVDE